MNKTLDDTLRSILGAVEQRHYNSKRRRGLDGAMQTNLELRMRENALRRRIG